MYNVYCIHPKDTTASIYHAHWIIDNTSVEQLGISEDFIHLARLSNAPGIIEEGTPISGEDYSSIKRIVEEALNSASSIHPSTCQADQPTDGTCFIIGNMVGKIEGCAKSGNGFVADCIIIEGNNLHRSVEVISRTERLMGIPASDYDYLNSLFSLALSRVRETVSRL